MQHDQKPNSQPAEEKPTPPQEEAPSVLEELWEIKEEFGYPQKILPWILAGIVLIIYLFTLNRWVRLQGVQWVMAATGWGADLVWEGSLWMLLTLPFRLLPDRLEPLALNVFTAFLGALAAWFLARTIAMLPFDRTIEARLRNDHPLGFLETRFAWFPRTAGVLIFALSLTPWEHGTAATKEMLDLVLFAAIAHCLALYRVYRRDRWLYLSAFLYGASMSNNFAMIPWLPVYAVAVIWLKGYELFEVQFLIRSALSFLAGLLFYLVLPIWYTIQRQTDASFFALLRTELSVQKRQILMFWGIRPRLLMALLMTLLPLTIACIRWKRRAEETSVAGLSFQFFLAKVVYFIMFLAAVGAFLDLPFGIRKTVPLTPLLPLYFIGAIAVGYYVGAFQLALEPPIHRRVRHEPGRELTFLFMGLTTLAAVAAPLYLAVRNLPYIRQESGKVLHQTVQAMLSPIQVRDLFLIGEDTTLLSLSQIAAHTGNKPLFLIPIASQGLRHLQYHKQMERRFGARWPALPQAEKLPPFFNERFVGAFVANLAKTSHLYYAHPSFGFFFENIYPTPKGMIHEMKLCGTNFLQGLKYGQEVLYQNERFWNKMESFLKQFPPYNQDEPLEIAYTRGIYSRALNAWGVILQRNHELKQAAKRFQQAIDLWPENIVAKANLQFNKQLQSGTLPAIDLTKPIPELQGIKLQWDQVFIYYGPPDDPRWTFRFAKLLLDGLNYRQALVELTRILELYPEDQIAQLWKGYAEALLWYVAGNTTLAERIATELRQKFPQRDMPLKALALIYSGQRQWDRVIQICEQRLKLNPKNLEALNMYAATLMRMGKDAQAIPYLDRALQIKPEFDEARLNRAIAYLKSGQLDQARQDYEKLLQKIKEKNLDDYRIYFGLGEIAYRKQEWAEALQYYQKYLKTAVPGTDEYRRIELRVKELKDRLGK